MKQKLGNQPARHTRPTRHNYSRENHGDLEVLADTDRKQTRKSKSTVQRPGSGKQGPEASTRKDGEYLPESSDDALIEAPLDEDATRSGSPPGQPAIEPADDPQLPPDDGPSPVDNIDDLQAPAECGDSAISRPDDEHNNRNLDLLDEAIPSHSLHTDTESHRSRDDNLTHLLFESDDESSGSDFETTQFRKRQSRLKRGLPTTSDEDEEEEEEFEAEIESNTRQMFRGKTVVSEGDKNSDDEDSYAKKSGPLSSEVKLRATALHDAYMQNMKELARESGASVHILHRYVGDFTVKHRDISTWNAFQAYQAAHGNGCPKNGSLAQWKATMQVLYQDALSTLDDPDDRNARRELFAKEIEWVENQVEVHKEVVKDKSRHKASVQKCVNEFIKLADQHYQNYGHSVFGYVISTTPDATGRSASSMWGNTETWKLLEAELKKKNITKMVTDFETIIRYNEMTANGDNPASTSYLIQLKNATSSTARDTDRARIPIHLLNDLRLISNEDPTVQVPTSMKWKEWPNFAYRNQVCILNWPPGRPIPGRDFTDFKKGWTSKDIENMVHPRDRQAGVRTQEPHSTESAEAGVRVVRWSDNDRLLPIRDMARIPIIKDTSNHVLSRVNDAKNFLVAAACFPDQDSESDDHRSRSHRHHRTHKESSKSYHRRSPSQSLSRSPSRSPLQSPSRSLSRSPSPRGRSHSLSVDLSREPGPSALNQPQRNRSPERVNRDTRPIGHKDHDKRRRRSHSRKRSRDNVKKRRLDKGREVDDRYYERRDKDDSYYHSSRHSRR